MKIAAFLFLLIAPAMALLSAPTTAVALQGQDDDHVEEEVGMSAYFTSDSEIVMTQDDQTYITQVLIESYNEVHRDANDDVEIEAAALERYESVPIMAAATRLGRAHRRWPSFSYFFFTYWLVMARRCHLCVFDDDDEPYLYDDKFEGDILAAVVGSTETHEIWEAVLCEMLKNGNDEKFHAIEECHIVVHHPEEHEAQLEKMRIM